jgi:hypothetical protein
MEGSPMHMFRQILVLPLVFGLAVSAPVLADQRHVVDAAAVAKIVDDHAAQQDADRAAIRAALERPEVRQVAQQIGIDLGRITASVSTLGGDDLVRAAAAARHVNDALAGGASTVVISTTTIIIALLVVILLIVALK